MDYRSCETVWVPAFAGKEEEGIRPRGPLHRFAVPLPQGGRIKNNVTLPPLGEVPANAGVGGLRPR